MNAFVANPPAPNGADIAGGEFWPGISIGTFRKSSRAAFEITDERAREALVGAMDRVMQELADWQSSRAEATLEAVPAEEIGGESRLVLLFRRAVFAYAAADLVQTHGDVSATGEGRDRIDDKRPSAADMWRVAAHAIRSIQGRPSTAVELI